MARIEAGPRLRDDDHPLAIIAACIVAAVVVTRLGVLLIERAHPPAGRFIDISGQRQHIVELGRDGGEAVLPIVLIHGASCNLEDMRLALGERLAVQRRVIMIDRPGLGWSERPAGQGSSPAYQAAGAARCARPARRRSRNRAGPFMGRRAGADVCARLSRARRQSHSAGAADPSVAAPPDMVLRSGVDPVRRLAVRADAGAAVRRRDARARLAHGVACRSSRRRIMCRRAASLLVLRPTQFLANAHDLSHLKAFLARQVVRYPTLAPPTVIITGDRDNTVSAKTHSMALARRGAARQAHRAPRHRPHAATCCGGSDCR